MKYLCAGNTNLVYFYLMLLNWRLHVNVKNNVCVQHFEFKWSRITRNCCKQTSQTWLNLALLMIQSYGSKDLKKKISAIYINQTCTQYFIYPSNCIIFSSCQMVFSDQLITSRYQHLADFYSKIENPI